jgi:hypothetical protein
VIGWFLVVVSAGAGAELKWQPVNGAAGDRTTALGDLVPADAIQLSAGDLMPPSSAQAAPPSDSESARLLRLAGEALRTRTAKRVVASSVGPTIEALTASSTPVPTIRFRLRKDWVEFRQTVAVTQGLHPSDAIAAAQVETLIDQRMASPVLSSPIITQQAADAALSSCSPELRARPGTLAPPFFNNDTGIRWFPDRNVLALEARAVKDISRNLCIRGVVDLVTAEVVCTELVCTVR